MSDGDIEQMKVTATDGDNTLVLLARDSVISCPGSISEWTLRWYHSAATNKCASVRFIFAVFRESSECDSLSLVGSNVYEVADTGPEMQEMESVFYVEPGDRFDVEEGDFISVCIVLNSECTMVESSLWVAGKTRVGARMYHNVFLTVFGALLLTALAPCSQLQQSNSIFPFLSAVVGK